METTSMLSNEEKNGIEIDAGLRYVKNDASFVPLRRKAVLSAGSST